MSRIALSVEGIAPDALIPFALDGEEAVSQLYRFTVSCVATHNEELTAELLGRSVRIEIAASDASEGRQVFGLVGEIVADDPAVGGQPIYRITVVPRFAQRAIGRYAQIYGTDDAVSVSHIIAAAMAGRLHAEALVSQTGATPIPYEVRFRRIYPTRDHVAQYEESDYTFMARHLENAGLFYFFETEEGKDAEKVIFADDNVFVGWIDAAKELTWRPWSPGTGSAPSRAVTSLRTTFRPLPRTVWLRDYDDLLGGTPIHELSLVSSAGLGDWTASEHAFLTPDEGRALARVRAEMLACHGTRHHGRTTSEALAAGRLFRLTEHPRDDLNRDYMVLSVRHRCRIPDVAVTVAPEQDAWFGYENEFEAIPHDVPFRPDLATPWPQVHGLTTGIVEGPAGQREPFLDDKGRYRVRMTADLAKSTQGGASRWIRKAEPYAGGETGMHFPLPPGTPVLIACINGDPDRPVIVGALPPSQEASVVSNAEQWVNRIVSRTGVTVTLGDRRLT